MKINLQFRQFRGYSLVELMIALTLGTFLAAGMIAIYLGNKHSFQLQESASRRLENGRFALSFLQHDIRAAAYRGCLRNIDDIGNDITLNSLASTTFLYNFNRALEGFEATSSSAWTPALDGSITNVVGGTDVITLRLPTDDPGVFVTADTAVTNPMCSSVQVDSNITPAFAAGNIVMITNCDRAEVFEVTAVTTVGASVSLTHAVAGPTGTPGNGNASTCTGGLATLVGPYLTGAQVMRIATISYFIRNSANNTGPALWRQVSNPLQVNGALPPPEELVEGIENMQVLYGTDPDSDLVPTSWVTANAVTNWNTVVAVRIALLAASTSQPKTETNTSTYNLLGTTVGPFTDGRLRRIYTNTISLRNRLK